MEWQEYLDVQHYCKEKSSIANSNSKKKVYDKLQAFLIRKSLASKSIPLQIKLSASEELKQLETKAQNPKELLQSFDEKYPGVLQNNWSNLTWNEVILEESLLTEVRDIGKIALEYYNVKPVGSKLGRVKSILLYGVPGCGKTSIAKAMAGQPTEPKIFFISAAQVCMGIFGESENFIKELFAILRVTIPSVLFIEEIDSIGRSRSKDKSEVSGRVLTQLTTEIENLEDGNLVVSTTNFPMMLDGALRRRFSKKFKVPLPDEQRRLEMLKLFLKGTSSIFL